MTWICTGRLAPPLATVAAFGTAFAALLVTGCGPGGIGGDGDGDTDPDQAYFELGQGETGFRFLEDGDELEMVLGGQGLLMFPMPIRGSGFGLPPDPSDYTHDKIPLLDATLDVEGFNTGVGGHFIYLANYRIPFTVTGDEYQFNYVALIVPDDFTDISGMDGRQGHLHAELQPYDLDEPLVFDRDVIIDTDGVPTGDPELGAL